MRNLGAGLSNCGFVTGNFFSFVQPIGRFLSLYCYIILLKELRLIQRGFLDSGHFLVKPGPLRKQKTKQEVISCRDSAKANG